MCRALANLGLLFVAGLIAACGRAPGTDEPPDMTPAQQKIAAAAPTASLAVTVVPEIVNPAEELAEFAPDGILRWTGVEGADVYEVWTYADAARSELVEFSRALSSRQYQFTQLAAGRTYYVKLYFRVGGLWGDAPPVQLRTATEVLKPRLTNAQEELDGLHTAGILRWTTVPGAETYELWVYRDAALTALAENSGPVRITQYRLRTLESGRTYYARLYSRIGGTFHAGGALPITVVATSDRARIVNPQEELDAFAVNGQLRWTAVTGATQYEAWVFTDPNSAVIQENSGPLAVRSYATRTLQPGATYYAQVYAYVNGQWQVGAPVKLTVTAQPTIARLTNAQEELEAFATTGTLRWTAVAGADRYEVWIYGNAGLGVVAESAAGIEPSYAVRRLCDDATYFVQVHARVNGSWTAGWATPLRVTEGASPADCVPPAPDVRLSVSTDEVLAGESVTLTWTSKFSAICTASDAWSGSRPLSGTERVGPIDAPQLFSLVCTGPSGTSLGQVLVTMKEPVTVKVWPPRANVTVNGTRQFSATVQGAVDQSVTWSLAGDSCPGIACGTISESGLYTAAAFLPGNDEIAVRATSRADPTQSGAGVAKIRAWDWAKFFGDFAYLCRGFWNDRPAQMAGKLEHVQGTYIGQGIIDRVSPDPPGPVLLESPLNGGYSLFADDRGEMNWWVIGGGVGFRLALSADGERGHFQAMYNPAVRVVCDMHRQTRDAYDSSAIQGDYVFQMTGAGDGDRAFASVGWLRADGAGHITMGTIDINDGVAIHERLALSGTYQVGENGRGTARLAVDSRGAANYVFHVVDGDRFAMLSVDAPTNGVPMQAGWATRQVRDSLGLSSMKGAAIFHLGGRRGATEPIVQVGLLGSDGAGRLSGIRDQNSAGTVTSYQPLSGTYSVDANGRGVIDSPVLGPVIFYLRRPNDALLMSAQPLVTGVQTGGWEAQATVPISNASLSAQHAFATVPPIITGSVTVTGMLFSDGRGGMTVPQDVVSPVYGLVPNAIGTGTYAMSSIGRATLTPTSGGSAVLWYVSPMKFVEILTGVAATPPEDKTLLFVAEQ